MKTQRIGQLVLAALTLLVAACAGFQTKESDAQRLARYEAVAGEPVNSFTYFSINSWTSLGRDALVIRDGVSRYWLLKVYEPCTDLPYAHVIALTGGPGRMVTTFDHVIAGRDRCRIREIRPIDSEAYKAASKAAREAANTAEPFGQVATKP